MTDLVHIPERLEGMVRFPERLQLITNQSDISAVDFDFEFNYKRILWDTGDASATATVLVTIPQ